MTATLDIREQEPLARYTSWKIGGSARFFANVTTAEALRDALAWARERDVPVHLLGGGTNTLVQDAGYDGLVLRFRAQEFAVEPEGPSTGSGQAKVLVRIDAGAPMAGTVRRLARQGLAGLEWAEGLPGTVGGAVFGNAGCYGSDTAAVLARAWLLVDGEIEEWDAAQFEYGYRTSVLKRATNDERRVTNESGTESRGENTPARLLTRSPVQAIVHRPSSIVVLAAEFRLQHADPGELAGRMAETSALRRSKTPSGQSCGSVFKNPPGDSAGRLVEAAGLKGTQVGGAQIAPKHGNYITNVGGATSDDVLRLADLMRERVARAFGVELELEVQVLGARDV